MMHPRRISTQQIRKCKIPVVSVLETVNELSQEQKLEQNLLNIHFCLFVFLYLITNGNDLNLQNKTNYAFLKL